MTRLVHTAAVALLALVLIGCRGAEVPEVNIEGMERRVAAAIQSATDAVLAERGEAARWAHFAMVLHAHGLETPALAGYTEAARLDDSDPRLFHLPGRLLENADPEAALALADAALELDPRFAPSLALRARILEALGSEDAQGAWEALHDAAPLSAEAALAQGRIALTGGEPEAATEALELAVAIAPDSAAAWSFLAQARRRLGDRPGAADAMTRAREAQSAPDRGVVLDPDPYLEALAELRVDSRGREARARLAGERGDHQTAEAIYESLLEERPQDPGLLYNLGNTLSRMGRSSEAENAYRSALAENPESSPAMANLANLLARDGRDREAAELYRQSATADPTHLPTLLGASSLHFQQGNLRQAERLLRSAIELDPTHAGALQGLGQLQATTGELAEAVGTLTRALQALEAQHAGSDQRAGLHFLLADVERQRGRREEALEHLARAESLGMEIPPSFRNAVSATR